MVYWMSFPFNNERKNSEISFIISQNKKKKKTNVSQREKERVKKCYEEFSQNAIVKECLSSLRAFII